MMRKGVRLFSSRALAVSTRGGLQVSAPESSSPPAESSVLVSGAGTAEANGTYTPRGTHDGKTYFNKEGSPDDWQLSSVVWTTGVGWEIRFSDGSTAYSNDSEDVANPWESAVWSGVDGAEPVPTVTEA